MREPIAARRERPTTASARPPAPALFAGAGNQAVAGLLARAPAPRAPKPPRALGDSVVDMVLRDAPALLPHLPEEWLQAKQTRLDAKASNADVARRQRDVYDDSRAHYPGLDPHGIGPTRDRMAKIGQEAVTVPVDVADPLIDTALLLDVDDILTPPPFNRAIEMRFRKALHAKLLTQQTRVTVTKEHGVLLYWNDEVRLDHTRGRVGFRNLTISGKFNEAYNNDVLRAPELVALEQAIPELGAMIEETRFAHEFRINKDAERPVIAWINRRLGSASPEDMLAIVADAQAHPEKGTAEQRLAEINAECPALEEWDKPTAALVRTKEILNQGQFEIALWAYGEAERDALRVAQRYESYEARIQRGGGTAIKWLGRAKIAGTIAAGIATGGSSLAVQVGAAAGYSLLREGAQQASEIAYDLRAAFNVSGLLRQASVEGAMAYLGAVTQIKFTEALNVRFGARLAELAGPVVAQRVLSAGAAATSAFYTAPAGRVLSKILAGGELPKSLEQLADLIVEEAIQNAALDLGIGIITAKGGGARPHATPDAPAGTGTPPTPLPGVPTAPNSNTTPLGAEQPPHVFELAGRAAKGEADAYKPLLDALGPWEEAMWHLRRGTGPANGIDPAMGRSLIGKLSEHRMQLVTELAAKFGAEPAGKPSAEPESDLDLNVKGDDAGTKAVKIKLYMDGAHPGWERRYRMAVMVDAGRTATVTDALARLPEAARAKISHRRALAAEAFQLMRLARAASTPGERSGLLNQIADPALREEATAWASLDAAGTRIEHDARLADTDRKLALVDRVAPDAQRVEDALLAQMKANALDPEAYVSAGAIETIVLGRKLAPQKAYEAVIDQLGMIHHQAGEAGGMRAALRRYETFKYIKRICDHLLATGMSDPRLTFLRNQAELTYNVERRATASPYARNLSAHDLTTTATTREVRHNDLERTPGVSDAFLADTYSMLDGLLTEQLPLLRRMALGEAGAPPVTLPPLGPEVPPGGGGVSHVERGLLAPGTLERIGGQAQHAPPAGADLQAQADHYWKPIASELQRLGVEPPKVVVTNLKNPASRGRFEFGPNTLFINEGALWGGKPLFDGSEVALQRLQSTLMHEARHAEQWFLAVRFRHLTTRDPATLMKELRVHMDIVQAAVDAPALVPGTREHAEAQTFYEAIYGAGAADARRSQDSGQWVEMVRRIHSLEAQSKLTQAKLEKVEWYELWKALKQSVLKHRLGKIQGEITRYKSDLDTRVEIYLKLTHEADARTAERLMAQVVGGNQLAAAARRHREAQATLDQLRRELRDGEHKEAAEAAAVALDDYGKLLLSVGENLTKVGAGAKP